MAKRYDQLLPLIGRFRPETIVEVGVHRAMRAVAMSREALLYQRRVAYVGFDVFDTVDAAFQEAALNGKGAPSRKEAERRLESLRKQKSGFSWHFVVGDTRETLHGQTVEADFAFIDGDHRVEAIRGDYEALKGCRCVVFDDYYRPGADGTMPDITLYGANAVVDALRERGETVTILPMADRTAHGGVSHLAMVVL